MKRDDIELIEKQTDLLEKELRILEENYNIKNLKKFNESKKNMFKIQKKITEVLK